jgi:hypothetical protein
MDLSTNKDSKNRPGISLIQNITLKD